MRRKPLAAALLPAVFLAAALSSAPRAAADDPPGSMGGAMGGTARRVVHDPAYFREHVLPLVERHCLECHADAKDNETKNRLAGRGKDGAWTDEAVEANYKNM